MGHFTIGRIGLSAPVAIGAIGKFSDRFWCAGGAGAAVRAGEKIVGDFEAFFGFETHEFSVERGVGEEDFAGRGDRSAVQNYGAGGGDRGAAVASEGACVGWEAVVGHDRIGVDLLQGQSITHPDRAGAFAGVNGTGRRSRRSRRSRHRSRDRGSLDGQKNSDRQEKNSVFHDVFG